jgi:hypothetical protein
MVNEVCLKVAGVLHEKTTQSHALMGLVMALVKHNGLIAEAYFRSLVWSGLCSLRDESNRKSQKRLSTGPCDGNGSAQRVWTLSDLVSVIGLVGGGRGSLRSRIEVVLGSGSKVWLKEG